MFPFLSFLSKCKVFLFRLTSNVSPPHTFVALGTEMVDSRLMGDFEADVKELEADSWSVTIDKKYLKQLKKDIIKRQDVIYGRTEDIYISLWSISFTEFLF